MSGLIARSVAAGLILLALTGSVTASDGYKLLRLGGTWVKWGDPAIGTTARVTYAIADSRMDFAGARNCRAMVPVGPTLEKSGISQKLFRREVRAAFDTWSKAANITFVQSEDPATADIVIGAQLRPRGRAYTNVDYAKTPRGDTRRIRKSLICFNPDVTWKVGFDGNIDIYDLRYTMLHEIGHAIGLDHPGPEGQVMSFKYSEQFKTLTHGDMAGARLLYGGHGPYAQQQPVAAPPQQQARAANGDGEPQEPPRLSLDAPESVRNTP